MQRHTIPRKKEIARVCGHSYQKVKKGTASGSPFSLCTAYQNPEGRRVYGRAVPGFFLCPSALGRPKWGRATARKKRLAACGKPNALLAPSKGRENRLRKLSQKRRDGEPSPPRCFAIKIHLSSSQNRMSITANCALVAVPWGFSVPSAMPVMTPRMVIQHRAS